MQLKYDFIAIICITGNLSKRVAETGIWLESGFWRFIKFLRKILRDGQITRPMSDQVRATNYTSHSNQVPQWSEWRSSLSCREALPMVNVNVIQLTGDHWSIIKFTPRKSELCSSPTKSHNSNRSGVPMHKCRGQSAVEVYQEVTNRSIPEQIIRNSPRIVPGADKNGVSP